MMGFSLPGRSRYTIRRRLFWNNMALGSLLLIAGGIAIWQMNRLTQAVGALQVARERAITALQVQQNSTQLMAIVSRLLPVEDATIFETGVTKTLGALKESNLALTELAREAKEDEVAYPLMNRVSGKVDSVIGIGETMVRQAWVGQWPSVRVRVGVLTRDQQQLAADANQLVDLADKMEEAAAAQVASAQTAVILYPALSLLLCMALGGLLSRQMRHSVVWPVEQLTEGAAQLAAGRLDKRVAVESLDELGQLATAFNQMADRLQASHVELERQVAERTADLQMALEDLARERNMLDATLDALPDLLFEVDRDGRIYDFRAPDPTALYRPPGEFLGRPVGQVLPKEAADIIMGALNQMVETGQSAGATYALEMQEGTEWFELSIAAKGDPGMPDGRFIALVRDVTARVRAERALEQRNRDLALLNRLGQELTSTLDPKQVVKRLLQAGTEVVGAEDASVWLWDKEQPGCLVCQTILHAYDGPVTDLRLQPGQGVAGWVARTGQSALILDVSQDYRFFPGIDAMIDFHTTSILSVPLWVRDKVTGALEIVNKLEGCFDEDDRVLTETLAASAAIALDNAGLVKALRQQTVQLQARNEELDAFAHTVAHDLKGPIGHMAGFAQTLEQDYAALPVEELRHYLHTVAHNGRKACNIIDELLLLASVRKVEEVKMSPQDMVAIIAEAQERLADLIEERQVRIILPDANMWPVAAGYGPWLEEVWVNYLSNAIKYSGQPPCITLGADPLPNPPSQAGEAIGGANRGGGMVRFWVQDNGPGLALEEQARLFTPFSRLDGIHAKGHGLGLSIVRRIVERLGGQVGVESEIGAGSVFWFTLPAADCTPTLSLPRSPWDAPDSPPGSRTGRAGEGRGGG